MVARLLENGADLDSGWGVGQGGHGGLKKIAFCALNILLFIKCFAFFPRARCGAFRAPESINQLKPKHIDESIRSARLVH